jgi:hypothetical protein
METVKITTKISQEIETTIEFPRYFKYLQSYYMVLGEGHLLAISDFGKPHYFSSGLLSSIRHDKITKYYFDNASLFQAITEEEFREVFVKVTVELEALMN